MKWAFFIRAMALVLASSMAFGQLRAQNSEFRDISELRVLSFELSFTSQALALPDAAAIRREAFHRGPVTVANLISSPFRRGKKAAAGKKVSPMKERLQALEKTLQALSDRSEASARAEISRLIAEDEGNIRLLEKLLRPESEGGMAASAMALRGFIWDALKVSSFGNLENIEKSTIDLAQIPYRRKYPHLKGRLQHALIKGHLENDGVLYLGRYFGKFPGCRNSDYELEMRDGLPVRIWFPEQGISCRFLKVVQVGDPSLPLSLAAKVLKTHLGVLTPRDIQKYTRDGKMAVVEWDLSSAGVLSVAGGKNGVNGKRDQWRQQAAFGIEHGDERVYLLIQNSNIQHVQSLDSELDEVFVRVLRQGRRETTTFRHTMAESEYALLRDGDELDDARLSKKRAEVQLGGDAVQLRFDSRYGGYRARIYDIRRTLEGKLLFVGALVKDGERIVTGKSLRLIHELTTRIPSKLFDRYSAELFSVFDYGVTAPRLVRKDGKTILRNYRISGDTLRLLEDGRLGSGGEWGSFKKMTFITRDGRRGSMDLRGAMVEAAILNDGLPNEKRWVRFLRDKNGDPIWNLQGEAVQIQVKPRPTSVSWPWPKVLDASWVKELRDMEAALLAMPAANGTLPGYRNGRLGERARLWVSLYRNLEKSKDSKNVPKRWSDSFNSLVESIDDIRYDLHILETDDASERARALSHLQTMVADCDALSSALLTAIDEASTPATRPWRDVAVEKYPGMLIRVKGAA